MSRLERAITLAASAHAGQVDKAGAPYFLHPLRVMLAVHGDAQRIAAILHDVIEDTGVTMVQLRELGFAGEVLDAVDALTKRPGVDYFDFVRRAAMNAVARPVKLADIADNMDLSRIANPTERDHARIVRYRRARKLIQAIGRDQEDPGLTTPIILPLRSRVTLEEVERECPGGGRVYACDFYIDGAERLGEDSGDGIAIGRVLNVDHHAPIPRMASPLTSTLLAALHRECWSGVPYDARVVINHTDCDSILSSAILLGLVRSCDAIEEASVCADHTGVENPIADLLQGLDEMREGDRTEEQYLESVRNLLLLLDDQPLEPAAQRALDRRMASRARAKELRDTGRVRQVGLVAFGELAEEIDGALFPLLFPNAAVILLASRHPWNPGHRTIKLRLGARVPEGFTLYSLDLESLDPAFGGRWNAGSNKRGGGTTMPLRDYVLELIRRVESRIGEPNATPAEQRLGDAVERPTASPWTKERLRLWMPGAYDLDGAEYEVDGTPEGGLVATGDGGSIADPIRVVTRGRRIPLTGEFAARWLQGFWELDDAVWEIGADPETGALCAWHPTLRFHGSPYLVIANGRRLTRLEATALASADETPTPA